MPILLPFRAGYPGSDAIYIPGEENPPLREEAGEGDDREPGGSPHEEPALFLYEQHFEGQVRRGVMGLLQRAEAMVFPHERTCSTRVAACLTGDDPGCLWIWCHDERGDLEPLLRIGKAAREETDRFGVLHRIAPVHEAGRVQDALEGNEFFLADGHHRFAAGWNFATIQIRNSTLRSRTGHDIDELERNARRGILLPPKSTDFWPKLAAGLVKPI